MQRSPRGISGHLAILSYLCRPCTLNPHPLSPLETAGDPQAIRHYDLDGVRWRSHDLRLARLHQGRYRRLAAVGEWVVAFDEQESVAQLVTPFAEPFEENLYRQHQGTIRDLFKP